MRRSKDIGTEFETSVVRYLRTAGFPNAERRALAGTHDLGDITGTPGVVWECKAGNAADKAGDGKVEDWLVETGRERFAAGADVGILVMKRSGYGPLRTGESWTVIRANQLAMLVGGRVLIAAGERPIRIHLSTMVVMLRAAGYGDPLPDGTQLAAVALNVTRLTA